jgi:hypothetical protein
MFFVLPKSFFRAGGTFDFLLQRFILLSLHFGGLANGWLTSRILTSPVSWCLSLAEISPKLILQIKNTAV